MMYKRIVKLKIWNRKCDFRESQYGNWIDLHVADNIALINPRLAVIATGKEEIQVPSFQEIKLSLGISTTLPKWYRMEIKPRSSTFKKYGLILTNSVGEIEYDYSGLIQAYCIKLGSNNELKFISEGDRLFQMQISLRPDAPWYMKIAELFRSGFIFKDVDVITTTRGGFGSTDEFNTQNLVLT